MRRDRKKVGNHCINDLESASKFDTTLYADETVLLVSDSNPNFLLYNKFFVNQLYKPKFLVNQLYNNKLLIVFIECFNKIKNVHDHLIRQSKNSTYFLPRVNKLIGHLPLGFQGIKNWNTIQSSIKDRHWFLQKTIQTLFN